MTKKLIITIISLALSSNPILAINVDFEFKNHCINNIIYFEDASSPKEKIISWFWEFGDGAVANENSPVHVYSESGFYGVKLTVKTKNGISYSQKKTILINPAPFAFFNPDSKCDQTVGFNDNSFTKNAKINKWFWNFGDGDYSLEKNPHHKFNKSNKTKVHLKVLDKNGCMDSITQLVKIKKKPIVGFEIKNVLLSNPTFIKVKSNNLKDFVSYTIGKKTISKHNTLLIPDPYTSTVIKQKVKNEMGCMDSLISIISPKQDFQIKLPSYFKPKSENYTSSFGINNANFVVIEMRIFNKNGEEVFYACNNTLWDGKDKKGMLCESGDYTYILDCENSRKVKITQKGKLFLQSE